jgi:hypothetical protein
MEKSAVKVIFEFQRGFNDISFICDLSSCFFDFWQTGMMGRPESFFLVADLLQLLYVGFVQLLIFRRFRLNATIIVF